MQDGGENQLLDMVGKHSLVEVVWKYWMGEWPDEKVAKMVEDIFIVALDHREGAPSAEATITAAKGGMDLVRAVEAGIGKINELHGGAVEGLGRVLVEDTREVKEIVRVYLAEGKRLPGFGHRIYKEVDPRTEYLLNRARELGFSGEYVDKVVRMEEELEVQKGKKLPINIDGAMASVLAELKVPVKIMNGFFLWPRVAGLIYRFEEFAG